MSNPPLTPSSPPPTPESQEKFDIGEEYGTAKKNLPPAGIVAICVVVVIAIVAIYSFTNRVKQHSTGTIDDVVITAVPGQNMVMVAINVSLQNSEKKPLWIKSIQVGADINGQKQSDDAIPAVDAKRYIETLPELKAHALQLLAPETQINPGEKIAGTVLGTFSVGADAFAARKSLIVSINPYDELPIVLTK
ncbi:MAG TPA: hypothetical protein VFM77_02320 [Terriglobales bacterium]|nr:hypothetical protein [Terriglobales bacterium]